MNNAKIENAISAPSRAQRLLSCNDILFQTVRPYQQNNYLFCGERNLPSVASTGYAVFRTRYDVQFLYALIHTKHFLNLVLSRCTGTSFPAISASDIENIIVSIPSIDEQSKIGEFFRLINAKIQKQKILVEFLKKYKRGVVKAIFSGKLNLSMEYPFENWENKAISECLNYEQPQKYIVNGEKYNDSFATPVLTANKGFILGYTDELHGIYNKGDVIIYDDFTMDMKYVTFNFKVKSSTIKMLTTTQDNDLYFMYALLQSLELQPEGHQRSYISKVEPMIVQVPPYQLQLRISDFLKNIDSRIGLEEQQLTSLVRQKQGLLQELFV